MITFQPSEDWIGFANDEYSRITELNNKELLEYFFDNVERDKRFKTISQHTINVLVEIDKRNLVTQKINLTLCSSGVKNAI